MNRLKKYSLLVGVMLVFFACKKDLDIRNPNLPTPESAATEDGIISLAQGGVYVNGFRDLKYGDGIYGLFWSGAMGFHEMLADVVQAEAANGFINQISTPDYVILDNGTKILNPNAPNTQKELVRQVNLNANRGANFLYYEWAYMYSMISACNSILEIGEKVEFANDGDSKKATLQAWAYFWKGYAYARIGSIYYAGLITNSSGTTNGDYVTKEQIIAESNSMLDKAASAISSVSNTTAYNDVLGRLIPSFNQVGKGGILTQDMWKRNINTLKARNILVNTTVTEMSPAQWQSILTLTNDGIKANDKIFTGRTNATGDFLSSSGGTVSLKAQAALAGGNTYKLSERWVMEFKDGDKRKENNVLQTQTWIGNSDRGNSFNTRFTLINGSNHMPGVIIYSSSTDGEYELYIAGSYEENELMKAEALMYTGSVDQGLASVDAVRVFQGAGLPAVSGTGLTLAQAKEELRRERRVAIAFLGLSFYDARRLGIINPLAQGGGRKGVIVVAPTTGVVNTNAQIEYGALDYWDVPDNELAYNPPSAGSAPVKNPK
ncbi:hypothetical protein [Pollutibacter soli]|uniref:hypothetical protein n=1 Tax=Pollutibacter soli TaxID=3034157 RepID=UPI00301359E8